MKILTDRSIALIATLLSLLTLQSCMSLTPQKQRGASLISSAGYRLSEGDVAIFPEDGTFAKNQAMEAFGKGDYAQSQDFFNQSLQQRPNDPEALIYKNNTIAALKTIPPLKLGVIIPGAADGSGSREVLRGVAQAQQEFNLTGGLNGHLLSITIGTDNNDAKIAPQVAASFVEQSEILGVVGHSSSGVSLAATETYTQGKLVVISPISSAVQLSGKSPYFFRTVPSDQVAAQALTKYMFEMFKRQKAAVYFNSESSYSKSLQGELKTAITNQSGETVAEYDLALPGLDLNATLVDAQQKGAEVILLASNTDSLDRALQIVRLNENRLPILGGDDVYSPKTLERTREKGTNMVLAVPWHIQATTSEDFANRSRKLWGGDVNWRTVTAYDATQALITALGKTKTRETIQQILRNPHFNAPGASRDIVFQSTGDSIAPVQLVQIIKGNRSGFGYDFNPIDFK